MRAAGRQPVGAVHPERIFPAQGGQVFGPNRVRVGRLARDQLDHRGEEGRLRAAEIVGAVPVRHVAVAVDQAGEVADHVEGQIATPALLQAEHREIGVPVVDLGEAPAGHDVGEGQRQQRAVGRDRARAGARAPTRARRCGRTHPGRAPPDSPDLAGRGRLKLRATNASRSKPGRARSSS